MSQDSPLLDKREAAKYLRVSLTFFQVNVRPFVTFVDLRKPMGKRPVPRWRREDLDTYINTHTVKRGAA